MQCALDVLKSESEQRAQLGLQEWWDALFIYLFFLKRKKKEKKKRALNLSLPCNTSTLVLTLLLAAWGSGTACLAWHSRAASQEYALGVFTTHRKGISQELGWGRQYSCRYQLAA